MRGQAGGRIPCTRLAVSIVIPMAIASKQHLSEMQIVGHHYFSHHISDTMHFAGFLAFSGSPCDNKISERNPRCIWLAGRSHAECAGQRQRRVFEFQELYVGVS